MRGEQACLRTGGLQILGWETGLAQALCLVFCFFRLFSIPPRQRGWSLSMMMVAIEDVVRADAMDAAGGAFNLFYLSAQCAH